MLLKIDGVTSSLNYCGKLKNSNSEFIYMNATNEFSAATILKNNSPVLHVLLQNIKIAVCFAVFKFTIVKKGLNNE